ncbi:MAG: molecular chaperone DnaK, partial [Gammaproteobacteria bacterium]|nr:molecular chaperone DnaK [Gammaproteobacteria bacterium]
LTDLKGKISEEEASNVESAIKDLEEVIKGDDRSIIEEKTKVLSDASAKIAEKLYAEQANTAGNSNSQDGGQKDDAVDAEFEEVKDKDSK